MAANNTAVAEEEAAAEAEAQRAAAADRAARRKAQKSSKIAVVLVRGNRYLYKKVLFKRGVPRMVSADLADILIDDVGYFRRLKIDGKTGKPIMPKPKQRKRRRGRARIIGASADSGYDEADGPDTEGSEEV